MAANVAITCESVYHARTSQGPRLTGISFIVTVFDKRLYLPAVIESLARQEGPFEREFVFVDDGSSDGSADLIAELTRGWRDKVLILHQPNRGASSATNEGAWRASYPWLKFLDGDDLLVPGATARLLEAANATRQSFAYGDLGTYRLDAPDPLGDGDPLQAPIILEPDGLARFIRNCPSNSSTMLVTSERYWQAGGCDERLISPDQALFLRLFAVGGGARVMGPVALAPQSAPGRLSEQRRRSRYESVLALYYLVTERKELGRAPSRPGLSPRARAGAHISSRLRRPVPVAPPAALSREPRSCAGRSRPRHVRGTRRLHRKRLDRAAAIVEAGGAAPARSGRSGRTRAVLRRGVRPHVRHRRLLRSRPSHRPVAVRGDRARDGRAARPSRARRGRIVVRSRSRHRLGLSAALDPRPFAGRASADAVGGRAARAALQRRDLQSSRIAARSRRRELARP